MFSTLPQTTQNQITQLSQQYGQPLERLVTLPTNKTFDPLNKKDRYGEVCMVVRRQNGRLLTMIKTYYPKGAYRLLTGGINRKESILDALLRETQEETGLEVKINRFLAAVAYRFPHAETPIFYTFAFLLDEISGTLGVIDEGEQIEDFREIEPHDLPAMAERLEHIADNTSQDPSDDWHNWGHFRAAIHTLVWQALTTQPL